ncbi:MULTISPECIES: ABC transporter ATP-binding protein [Auritidibacter]|uniref:ABC-type quaternary amine transporter n=1 Tax=Auritidibacter ignavus TaxID=678932 RepID=A0AAJ6AFG5_9MICC|nr:MULTISPECIES: ATP-binding cassette domain-containing protein [Auritidibacter]AXR74311.1 ATP-binding cassette domain-containing protein [Auritidibacter sp. NML130574]WGH83040.1 ATP-binding cassette domain-containing protein [Auritidibacter ignavus]WGH90014.1 ATP-binding cassette domain-containing protein [Auritidibacter ignavus]WGH92316.1 ATP-binding cassette domain-containing protein [Auritidibacter ignavus]WHS29318.1 ATP-binding cassette domain-containing protein [Auritidibacter ignavus]
MTESQRHHESNRGVEIELRKVSKRYPGQKNPAVQEMDLVIPAGEMVMFVGPSGCGKTTTLKMINRLIEPSAGTILIDGDDVTNHNPTRLRRNIGYVIQGGGMLPHLTVGANIGLVPGLLKWDKKRIRARVDELLDMVGLDPQIYRDRYPRELSGGQQQRVGVARGLAADPPIVLMDEPFGAVDPVTRSRLQDELMRIQSELQKTIVCVTHDIDEAIKLGDRMVIFQPGATIAQYDTPEKVLAAPASDFVDDFIGAGSTLKQLSLRRVDELGLSHPPTARIGESVDEVVQRATVAGASAVVILNERDEPRDWVSLRTLQRQATVPDPKADLQTVIDHRSTLNDALDAMLTSSHGGAMVVKRGTYQGVLLYETVTDYVRALNEQVAQPVHDEQQPGSSDNLTDDVRGVN